MALLKNGINIKFADFQEKVKADCKVIEENDYDINLKDAKLMNKKDDNFKYIIGVNPSEYAQDDKKSKVYYKTYFNALTLADSLKVENVYLADIFNSMFNKPHTKSSYIVLRAISNIKFKFIKEIIIDYDFDHQVNLSIISNESEDELEKLDEMFDL